MDLQIIKNKTICEEICAIFAAQFPTSFNINPNDLLLNNDYVIFYIRDIMGIKYCAINTIHHLCLGRTAINFSYSSLLFEINASYSAFLSSYSLSFSIIKLSCSFDLSSNSFV